MRALNAFEGQGIEFTAAGDKLRYRALEAVITDEIRASLKAHKRRFWVYFVGGKYGISDWSKSARIFGWSGVGLTSRTVGCGGQ